MKSSMFYKRLPKEITYKISKYSLNVFFLCYCNQITKRDMEEIFENYDYSKDEYYDIIEYSLIPTLLYFDKYSLFKELNVNWTVNDTVFAYFAIKYQRYHLIEKPLFIDKLFLEGIIKNYPEAINTIGHYLYYIPEDNCHSFFRMYHRQGQDVFRPSKYSIQFKNKEAYYSLLKELLPDYKEYEKYIYGSPALIDHLDNVLDIEKIVKQSNEKNCSLRSPCSSPTEERKSVCSSKTARSGSTGSTSSTSSTTNQDINKFYPYLYDYLFLFKSSEKISKEEIFKLTMNSWNCSLVTVKLYDLFHTRNSGGRRADLTPSQKLDYQKALVNAKRMANGYTVEDDLLQYRLVMEENYLSLENLFDVYLKILEYDNGKQNYYRIDHLFHIFFPTIVLLIINKDVKHLKAYLSLLTYRHWVEHVVALFDYAIEFYQFKMDKFPNQIEKLKRKYPQEFKHYKTALNNFLESKY